MPEKSASEKKAGDPLEHLTDSQREEWTRCKADPVYWIETYCKIIDANTESIHPFIGYPTQKGLWGDYAQAHFDPTAPRYFVLLKARQVGYTWATCAFAHWKILFFDNQTVTFISENEDLAKEMMERVNFMYSNLPSWMQLETVTNNTGAIHFGRKARRTGILLPGSRNSKIQCVATTPTGVQSKTVNMAVVDEAASVAYVRSIFQRSIKPALERGRGICVVLSTAKPRIWAGGAGKFFEDIYWKAKRKPKQGKIRYKAHFTGCFEVPGRDEKWYKAEREDAEDEAVFCQEYPRTDVEAFTTAGRQIFDANRLHKRLEQIMADRLPRQRGFLVNGEFKRSTSSGDIWIYKQPEPDHQYSAGVDCSSGVSKDRTAIKVKDADTGEEVARAWGKIKPVPTAYIANWLGRRYNDAIMVVEIELHGTKVQDVLIEELSYPYIYIRRTLNKTTNMFERNLGWKTTRVTRPKLIDDLVEVVNNGKQVINDVETIKEMLEFEEDENGRPDHPPGGSSDLLFASGLAHQGTLYGMGSRVKPPQDTGDEIPTVWKSYRQMREREEEEAEAIAQESWS
jgi:hypothetical protein